jgi:dihydroxy-acid dehydratase
VITPYDKPVMANAGSIVLGGNLFRSAFMKTSVISPGFRERYLSDPKDPNAFVGRAIVFEGPEDYHARIDDPSLNIDERCILVMRNCGPLGYPGSAEVVNMQPPTALLKRGIKSLPTIGDGRQSGTADSPSIVNASPEAAAGGNLATCARHASTSSFPTKRSQREESRCRRLHWKIRHRGSSCIGKPSASSTPVAVSSSP